MSDLNYPIGRFRLPGTLSPEERREAVAAIAAAPSRPLHHPESGEMRVDELAAFYAWHGEHHTTHITSLRERNGW